MSSAQTRRGTTKSRTAVNKNSSEEAAKCSGWRGKITKKDSSSKKLVESARLFIDEEKRVNLQTEFTDGGAAVKNAPVSAKITPANSDPVSIELFDDGKHDDEKAGDGIYAGKSQALASGEYLIEVRAASQTAAKIFTVR